MKRIIKSLTIVLSIFVLVNFFSGCSGANKKSENSENNSSKTHDKAKDEKTEEVVEEKTFDFKTDGGAILTWCDPKTGKFKYTLVCEYCGRVDGTTYDGEVRDEDIPANTNGKYTTVRYLETPHCQYCGRPSTAQILYIVE